MNLLSSFVIFNLLGQQHLGRLPAQPDTASSRNRPSHRIPQTLSLQPIPPRRNRTHILSRRTIQRTTGSRDSPQSMTTRARGCSQCLLGTRPSDPCRPRSSCVSCRHRVCMQRVLIRDRPVSWSDSHRASQSVRAILGAATTRNHIRAEYSTRGDENYTTTTCRGLENTRFLNVSSEDAPSRGHTCPQRGRLKMIFVFRNSFCMYFAAENAGYGRHSSAAHLTPLWSRGCFTDRLVS